MFIFFVCLYALYLGVQRKRTSSEAAKERAPRSLGPSGFLALLAVDGTLKTRPAKHSGTQTGPASYSANSYDAQRD